MTIPIKYTRIFIGDVARWPMDRQLETCRQYDPEQKAIYKPKEFDQYVKDLRADEVALVARLVAIAEKKPKKRPGVSFVLRLLRLLDTCAYIQDAQTGIKSTDGQKWLDLVEQTYGTITRGRELKPAQASELAKLSHEAREPGLVEDWLSKKGTKEYFDCAAIWGNMDIKPAAKAIAMLPDKELKTVSPSTMRWIFGSRKQCLEWLNDQ